MSKRTSKSELLDVFPNRPNQKIADKSELLNVGRTTRSSLNKNLFTVCPYANTVVSYVGNQNISKTRNSYSPGPKRTKQNESDNNDDVPTSTIPTTVAATTQTASQQRPRPRASNTAPRTPPTIRARSMSVAPKAMTRRTMSPVTNATSTDCTSSLVDPPPARRVGRPRRSASVFPRNIASDPKADPKESEITVIPKTRKETIKASKESTKTSKDTAKVSKVGVSKDSLVVQKKTLKAQKETPEATKENVISKESLKKTGGKSSIAKQAQKPPRAYSVSYLINHKAMDGARNEAKATSKADVKPPVLPEKVEPVRATNKNQSKAGRIPNKQVSFETSKQSATKKTIRQENKLQNSVRTDPVNTTQKRAKLRARTVMINPVLMPSRPPRTFKDYDFKPKYARDDATVNREVAEKMKKEKARKEMRERLGESSNSGPMNTPNVEEFNHVVSDPVVVPGSLAIEYNNFDFLLQRQLIINLSCFRPQHEQFLGVALALAGSEMVNKLTAGTVETFYKSELIPAIANMLKYESKPEDFTDVNEGKYERYTEGGAIVEVPLPPKPEIFPFQIRKRIRLRERELARQREESIRQQHADDEAMRAREAAMVAENARRAAAHRMQAPNFHNHMAHLAHQQEIHYGNVLRQIYAGQQQFYAPFQYPQGAYPDQNNNQHYQGFQNPPNFFDPNAFNMHNPHHQ